MNITFVGSTNGIKSATLSFANSPDRIQIGALNVSGSTVYSNFTTRTTKSMTFTILTTNSGAKSVGLAEIQIFNNPTFVPLSLFSFDDLISLSCDTM